MQQPNEHETIVRFSGAWWTYTVFRSGWLRALVNGIEDALAVSGRFLLLLYLFYCGAQVGAFLIAPNFPFPLALEMTMFVLQIAGLEGSIPGLARQAEVLRGKPEGAAQARKVERVMLSARIMTICAFAEGAAHALKIPAPLLQDASAVLLVARGVVITGFLIELAKIEKQAPRIISKNAHAQEQAERAVRDEQACTIADLQHEVSSLQHHLDAERQQVSRLQAELDTEQGDATTLRRDLGTALIEAETLRSQLDSKQREVESLREQIESGQDWQSARTRQLLDAERQQVSRLQTQLCEEQAKVVALHQEVQAANLQNSRLQTDLQACKLQRADLQNADHMQTAEPAKKRPAKAGQPGNVTSFETAKMQRVSHAQVVAYMTENPGLKRAEVAAKLGISERKVYDALAWQKEQEHAASS